MMFKLATITEFMLSVLPGSGNKPQLCFNIPPFNHNYYKVNNTHNFDSVDHFLKENVLNNKQSLHQQQQSQHTTLSKEKWKIVFRKSEKELNNNEQQNIDNTTKKINEEPLEEKLDELAINMETNNNTEPEDFIYNQQKIHSTNSNDDSVQLQETSESSDSSYYSALNNKIDTSLANQLEEDDNEDITVKEETNSISEKKDNDINQHATTGYQCPAKEEASLRNSNANNDQQNNNNNSSTTFICGKPAEEWWMEQYKKIQESQLKKLDDTTSAHIQQKDQVQQQRQEENDLQLQIVKQHQVLFEQIQKQFELQQIQQQKIQDEKIKQQQQIQEEFERQKQLEVNQRQNQQQQHFEQQQQQHFEHFEYEEHYYEQQQHYEQFNQHRQQRQLWNNNPVNNYKLFQPYPVIMNSNNQIYQPPAPFYNNFQRQHNNPLYPNQHVEEPVFMPLQELNNINTKRRRENASRRKHHNRNSNQNNHQNIIQIPPQLQNIIPAPVPQQNQIPAPPQQQSVITAAPQQEQDIANNINTNDTYPKKVMTDADLLAKMNEKIALIEKICRKKPGFDITQKIPATAITVSQLYRSQKDLKKKQIEQEKAQLNDSNDIHEKFRELIENLKNFDPASRSRKERHQELIRKMDVAKYYFIKAIFGNTMLTKSMEKEITFSLCKHFTLKNDDENEEQQRHSVIPPRQLCILGVTHNNQNIANTLNLQQYQIFQTRQQNIAKRIREIMPNQNLFIYHGEFKDYYDCGNRILGEGLNGCVINGFCKSNPERTEVAIKNITLDIDKERVNEFIINGTLIEIFATTKAANHPNIIRTQMVFFKDNRLTLILELMHGSVKNLMDKAIYTNTKFSVGQVVYIALEILKALTYLHERVSLLHGDIKSDNILINRDGQVKLSDFGLSKSLRTEALEVSGTAQWMAPEVADRERYSNEKSDIWSFGMTLIELIDLDVPGNDRFCDANLQDQEEVIQIIAHSRHVPSFKRPNFSHVLHIMLMKYILCLNPEQRRTSSQLENVLNFSVRTGELDCCTKEEMAKFISCLETNYSRMINKAHQNKK